MRGAFHALDEGKLVPYSTAAFEAYWGDDRDIAREEVLADIAAKAGLDRQRFFAAIETDACKQKLRANTDELMARGGFGSPDDVRGRRDVLRQRSPAAGEGGVGGGVMRPLLPSPRWREIFRIAPPHTIDAGEIDLGLEIFDRALARAVH